LACTHSCTGKVNRACTARCDPAAELGARETKFISQIPKQRHVRVAFIAALGPVDDESRHSWSFRSCSSAIFGIQVGRPMRHLTCTSGKTGAQGLSAALPTSSKFERGFQYSGASYLQNA